MRTWQAADAKQNFGRLVDAAKEGPQMLLRGAEPVGVVLSFDDYITLREQADAEFAEFLLATPMEESDFDAGVGLSLAGG